MLAPLKDRSIIRQATKEASAADSRLVAENASLKQALRLARQAQKRAATLSTRQIIELTNANYRLSDRTNQLSQRLAELESGQTMLVMGQRLMALRQENDKLAAAAEQLWFIDRTLRAAHCECERLAVERDEALRRPQLRHKRSA